MPPSRSGPDPHHPRPPPGRMRRWRRPGVATGHRAGAGMVPRGGQARPAGMADDPVVVAIQGPSAPPPAGCGAGAVRGVATGHRAGAGMVPRGGQARPAGMATGAARRTRPQAEATEDSRPRALPQLWAGRASRAGFRKGWPYPTPLPDRTTASALRSAAAPDGRSEGFERSRRSSGSWQASKPKGETSRERATTHRGGAGAAASG